MGAIIKRKSLVVDVEEDKVECYCSLETDKWGIKRKNKIRSGRSIKMYCRNSKCSNTVLFSFLTFFVLGTLVGPGLCWETRRNDRNPFLENHNRRSPPSSSSSLPSQYKNEQRRMLYSQSSSTNDNRMTMRRSMMSSNSDLTRNLLRSSTSALLENSALLTSLHGSRQWENNRVASAITPNEQNFILQNNDNTNNRGINKKRNNGGGSSSSSSSSNSPKKKKAYFPPRPASVNSILSLESALTVWEDTNTICHKIPGLTREQMELCIRAPETTKVAVQGIQMATEECAWQMQTHRWNCSAIQGNANPHGTQMFQKGYRESAFGHAIAAAGVAYAVAKACSQGKLLSCGCGFQYDDQVNYVPSSAQQPGKDVADLFDGSNNNIFNKRSDENGVGGGANSISSWKWSGCSHNMDYGMKFAKLFLDSREKSHDLPALTNLHNNKVGRVAVSANMEVRCKCHGLSGSCELRTCWRSPPEFRRVGTFLKNKFRRAIMIDQSELGNRPLSRVQKLNKQKRRKRRDRETGKSKRSNANIDLWYYERSPTYCESNRDKSILGTTGRRCNTTGDGGGKGESGSCSTLCCGRGYNTIRQVYTTRCNCQFIWCCQVTCKNCTVDEWITVCK